MGQEPDRDHGMEGVSNQSAAKDHEDSQVSVLQPSEPVVGIRRAVTGSVPSFVEKEKRRNLLLTKQIAQRGEGGIRREEGYHD